MELQEPADVTESYNSWRDELHRAVENDEHLVIDYYSVRALSGTSRKGKITRRPTQFTISEKTWERFVEFMIVMSGTQQHRGRGIASQLADTALTLLMAVYTQAGAEEAIDAIIGSLNTTDDAKRIHENLRVLLEEVEKFIK